MLVLDGEAEPVWGFGAQEVTMELAVEGVLMDISALLAKVPGLRSRVRKRARSDAGGVARECLNEEPPVTCVLGECLTNKPSGHSPKL
eukprot:2621458-Lingulodinium_polyedra.AAC.1